MDTTTPAKRKRRDQSRVLCSRAPAALRSGVFNSRGNLRASRRSDVISIAMI
jgi:hypothetical protein